MKLFPDFSKYEGTPAEVVKERKQMKLFIIVALFLVIVSFGTQYSNGLFGKTNQPEEKNPSTQISPTPSPSPLPKVMLSPTQKAGKNTCADYRVGGKEITVCATCGNAVCEAFETCTSSISNETTATDDCGKLYCPKDCEKITPSPKSVSPTPTPSPITQKSISPTTSMKACPMDAKLCPDGKTYVGRSGPNCEFVACPAK